MVLLVRIRFVLWQERKIGRYTAQKNLTARKGSGGGEEKQNGFEDSSVPFQKSVAQGLTGWHHRPHPITWASGRTISSVARGIFLQKPRLAPIKCKGNWTPI